ncbi:MAG: hypothetical protein ACYC1E_16140 [Propionibacteriaceae bacterium]
MNAAEVDQILRELAFLRTATDDPELRALQIAIFIEDVFGVTLTDAQFGSHLLNDPAALRVLLAPATSLV